MKRLILIRHGETDWSKENKYLGTAEIPLNQKGIEQAKAIAQALKREVLNTVYSSILSRAMVTAEIIAKESGVPLQKDPRLNELSFGSWEGQTLAEITEQDPNVWSRWQEEFESFSPPRGEQIRELKDRVLYFLQTLIESPDYHAVAIVSHAGPIKVILLHALGAPLKSFWRIKLDLGAISIIEYYSHGPIVTSINDTSHLR